MGAGMSRLIHPIDQADKLFRGFHGRSPHQGELRKLVTPPTVALEVGELVRLVYASKSENVERFHIFAKKNRPVLFVSADGSQAYILAGGYRFTAKGFEG